MCGNQVRCGSTSGIPSGALGDPARSLAVVPSILGEARGDFAHSARDITLQEGGVVADSSEGDRDATEDFWSLSGEFGYRHRVVPRKQVCVP